MLDKLLPGWTIKKADGDEVLVVAPNGNGSHVQNKGSLVNRVLYQLASAIIEAATPNQKDMGWRECSYNFARHEDGGVTTLGVLKLQTSHSDDDTAWRALVEAITVWVATTDAGREAWTGSSHDLNIGDLASFNAFQDADFQRLLADRGLQFIDLMVSDADESINYDEVLVDTAALQHIAQPRQGS